MSGPLSAEELGERLDSGKASPHDLVSSDLGDRPERLRQGRSCDWFRLAEVPELAARFPPPEPARTKKRPITRLHLAALAALTVNGVAQAYSRQSWIALVAALALAGVAIHSLRLYRKQAGPRGYSPDA